MTKYILKLFSLFVSPTILVFRMKHGEITMGSP